MTTTINKLIKTYGKEKTKRLQQQYNTMYDSKHLKDSQLFDFTSQLFYEARKSVVMNRYFSKYYLRGK